VLNDNAAPNDVEHLLLNYIAKEKVQDLVDDECAQNNAIDMWPEHWEDAGAIPVWKCFVCGRLYIDPFGKIDEIVVYSIETTIKKQ
jgi:hypothetical protein